MSEGSRIEWTEATWNPVAGCAIVSPGCTNCYAMRMSARLQIMKHAKYRGTTRKSGNRYIWTGKVNFDEGALDAPLRWHKPLRIFVNSMSDLFQEQVPFDFIAKVWRVMEQAHWHIFQILTKRPDRMRAILNTKGFKVLPNVWLGTSIESADYLDRLDELRHTPAKVRFISFEPLLGPIGDADLVGVHWAIVGGESGPRARPMERDWVRNIRRLCREQDVAFFFKQWGGFNKKRTGRRLDGRTWDEYPVHRSRRTRAASIAAE
jgi:protein gp37